MERLKEHLRLKERDLAELGIVREYKSKQALGGLQGDGSERRAHAAASTKRP